MRNRCKETKKLQNLRRGGTMVEKIKRIQAAGMEVWAGMILGFDNDDESIFAAQAAFIAEARISTAMIGMLSAIPRTPLFDRLEKAGRLDLADEPEFGTNVLPVKMSREMLSRGFIALMSELYNSRAYFDRVDDLYGKGRIVIDKGWQGYAASHPWARRRHHARLWLEAFGLMARLATKIPDAEFAQDLSQALLGLRPRAARARSGAHLRAQMCGSLAHAPVRAHSCGAGPAADQYLLRFGRCDRAIDPARNLRRYRHHGQAKLGAVDEP